MGGALVVIIGGETMASEPVRPGGEKLPGGNPVLGTGSISYGIEDALDQEDPFVRWLLRGSGSRWRGGPCRRGSVCGGWILRHGRILRRLRGTSGEEHRPGDHRYS
jgi:hypothetical protein